MGSFNPADGLYCITSVVTSSDGGGFTKLSLQLQAASMLVSSCTKRARVTICAGLLINWHLNFCGLGLKMGACPCSVLLLRN